MVNPKDGFDFAMLFTLRLLQRQVTVRLSLAVFAALLLFSGMKDFKFRGDQLIMGKAQ